MLRYGTGPWRARSSNKWYINTCLVVPVRNGLKVKLVGAMYKRASLHKMRAAHNVYRAQRVSSETRRASQSPLIFTPQMKVMVDCLVAVKQKAIAMVLQSMTAILLVSGMGALYFSIGGTCALCMFVFTFAFGAGPVPGLRLSEIFPSAIRAEAMAICMSVHWFVNLFVRLLFLRLLEQHGPQPLYSMFATFCMMAVVFVKRNVVETKGRSLQIEIALPPQD